MSTKTIDTQYSTSDLASTAADYAGDFASDYDLDAVAADWNAAINEQLPEGVVMANNGQVFYDQDFDLDSIDLKDIVESIDLDALLQAHDSSN